MADVAGICKWIVKLEDDNRHPGISKDLGDGAGHTRIGITERWHSADVPADFFTTMPNAQAYSVAESFYARVYCGPLRVAAIASTELAASLVSFAVNETIKEAVWELQQVLDIEENGVLDGDVTADGVLGPATLAELNSKDGGITAKLYRAQWEDFYRRKDALNHARDDQWLNGWLRRAALVYPQTL